MAINLIDKIIPKNAAFTGLVDAEQVIGDGATNVLPDNCVAESNVTQHEGAIDHGSISGLADDDHTQYHTDARGDARYIKPTTASYVDLTDGGTTGLHSHPNDAANNSATFSGTNWTDLTDGGATTLHKHDHGGMDGLSDNDHPQYVLAASANYVDLTDGGWTSLHKHSTDDRGNDSSTFSGTNWVDLTDGGETTLHTHPAGEGGVTDHGELDGLADNDHPQYVLTASANYVDLTDGGWTSLHKHSTDDRGNDSSTFSGTNWVDLTDTGATTLHKHDHGGMDGLSDNDHPQYVLATSANYVDLTDGGWTSLHSHSTDDRGNDSSTFSGTNWVDLTDTGATTLHKHDHGGMDGLADDDHTQYLLVTGARGATEFGIGTDVIPHGAVGAAKLAIEGTDSSTAGPHVQFTTASDDHSLLQILPYTHDNVNIAFDSYFDGTNFKSSDAGSNFCIRKLSDTLQFFGDDGIAQGSAISWNLGLAMTPTGGVGIGTATVPHGGIGSAKLAIEGTNASANGPHIQLTTASDDYPLFQIEAYSHDVMALKFDCYWDGVSDKSSDAGSNFDILKYIDLLSIRYDSGIAVGSAITWNNGIVLNTSGSVGINGTPTNQLSIFSSSEWPLHQRFAGDTVSNRNTHIFQRARGSLSSPTVPTNTTVLGGLSFAGWDGSNWKYAWDGGAEILAYATETWSTTAKGTKLTFDTTTNATVTPVTRMVIENDGRVGIGVSPSLSRLHVYDDVAAACGFFHNDGNAANRLGPFISCGKDSPASNGDCVWLTFQDGNGGATGQIQYSTSSPYVAFAATSDERLKTNISPSKVDALSILNNIKLFEFDWKDGKRNHQDISYVAQQVATVYPPMVAQGLDGYLTVSDSCLIPVLVKAVQDLSQQVTILKEELACRSKS